MNTIKKAILGLTLALGLIFGSVNFAHAATFQDLLNQLERIRAQVIALMQGQTTITPPAAEWRHTFNRNLRYGDRGAEVLALKQALQKEGLLSQNVNTNLFDEYTASAVVAFQEKYASEILTPGGLTHGTGFVGPATRAKLNQLYGGYVNPPPQYGNLTITSPNGGETWQKGTSQSITWTVPQNYNYNYQNVSITLINNQDGSQRAIANSIPISLGSYTWAVPSNVVAGSMYKVRITSNQIMPMMMPYYYYNDESNGYFSITDYNNQNVYPVINSVSGPSSLTVGQTGTWTINARDPQDGVMTYSVLWGDEYRTLSAQALLPVYGQTTTFTHVYANPGTYTVTFYVRNTAGNTATSTMTVIVR